MALRHYREERRKKSKAGLANSTKKALAQIKAASKFLERMPSAPPTTALIWAQDANALMFFSEYEKLQERTAYRGRYEDDGEQYGGKDEQAILNYLDDETSIVYTSMQGNQMHQLVYLQDPISLNRIRSISINLN